MEENVGCGGFAGLGFGLKGVAGGLCFAGGVDNGVGGPLGDRRVAIVPVVLAGQQSVTISATMRSGRGQTGDPVLTTTPGIEQSANDVRVRSACR